MIFAPFIVEGEKYDWLCIQDNQYVALNCKAIVNTLSTDSLSSQFELGSVSFCDNWDEALFGAAAMIIEIWQGHLQFQDLKKWLKLMKYISFNHLLTSEIVVFTETFFFSVCMLWRHVYISGWRMWLILVQPYNERET